ncbi:hypothetical protein [Streptomyces sp. NPDC048638]|uniref:hypothetical protein n=1 Tax=Streptomyces sp. NPDC048638 TaxID=3365580 RepID=UPI0037152119
MAEEPEPAPGLVPEPAPDVRPNTVDEPVQEPSPEPAGTRDTPTAGRRLGRWMTAHWWTGIGGVVGVLALVVGLLAWLLPVGGDSGDEAGNDRGAQEAQAEERWSSPLSLGNAPLDLDTIPPTRHSDRASSDIWVSTVDAWSTDRVAVSPGSLSAVRRWRGADEPSPDACRGELRRPTEDPAQVKYGEFFCVRTSEDRIAVIAVESIDKDTSGAVGCTLDVTVLNKHAG